MSGDTRGFADIAQLVECQPSKLDVASSNLVIRSIADIGNNHNTLLTMKKILRIARLFKRILETSQRESNADIVLRLNELDERIQNAMICNKPYLTKKEAAEYMGVSTRFLESLIRNREITYYQPVENSYLTYIYRMDIDRFISRYEMMSKHQIKANARRIK